ncbi:MAG: tetratricopeptide repeat protein [Desulfosalsimonas sp.]
MAQGLERAAAGSAGMFCARIITEKFDSHEAAQRLAQMDAMMPEKYYVQFYLGKIRMEIGKTRAAIAHFQSALALDPHPQDISSIYSYMGQALKDAGDYDQALRTAEKGLEWTMNAVICTIWPDSAILRKKTMKPRLTAFPK